MIKIAPGGIRLPFFLFVAALTIAGLASHFLARRRVVVMAAAAKIRTRSLPSYYGAYAAFWTVLPMLMAALAMLSMAKGLSAVAFVSGLCGLVGCGLGLMHVRPEVAAREKVETLMQAALVLASATSLMITGAIVLSVAFEAWRFFQVIAPTDFLFGLQWSPQMAIRADQGGSSGAFGAVPLFLGTLLIMLVAMLVAIPVGLYSAIYLAEYAPPAARTWLKPALEILAGIPTVVYGYFAINSVAPLLRWLGSEVGLDIASESALAAGLVMGVMIIPFISSLSDDIITAVPNALRDASLALGATKSETIRQVVLPAALPGVMGAVLLAISRAIGETMIVVMAAGLSATLTFNPLSSVTTVTVQIVALLVGDQAFDSPKTMAAFALGLSLFVGTLLLNVIALIIVKKYREQYE